MGFTTNRSTAKPFLLYASYCLFASLIFISGCKKASITGTETDSVVIFSGTIEAIYHSALRTRSPLVGATLLLDSVSVQTDSSGNFSFPPMQSGAHQLRITAPDIVPIDTTVTLSGSEPSHFSFMFYRFGGTVAFIEPDPYRLLRSIKTTMLIDGRHSFETTTDAANFDCGFLTAGYHTLHIERTSTTLPLDTTFLCGLPNDFGTQNAYRFYVGGIPQTFQFPSAVGTSWRYGYSLVSYVATSYLTSKISGTRLWTVNSLTQNGSTLTLNLSDVRRDTVVLDYDIGPYPDTSYVTHDTVYFTIVMDDSSIRVNSPECAFSFAKVFVGGDTLKLNPVNPDYRTVSSYTIVNNVGLVYSSNGYSGNSSASIKMSLLDYTNP